MKIQFINEQFGSDAFDKRSSNWCGEEIFILKTEEMEWEDVFLSPGDAECARQLPKGTKIAKVTSQFMNDGGDIDIPVLEFESDGWVVNLDNRKDSPIWNGNMGSPSGIAFGDDGKNWYIFPEGTFSVNGESYPSKLMREEDIDWVLTNLEMDCFWG